MAGRGANRDGRMPAQPAPDFGAMCHQVAAAHARYRSERDPFRRAHRLIDTFEVAVKYAVAVALFAALAREESKEGRDRLVRMFGDSILRPSLGHWRGYLRSLLQPEGGKRPAAVPESGPFADVSAAYPEAAGTLDALVALRNEYAHGATRADHLCNADLARHEPDLARVIAALAPLFMLPLHAPVAGGADAELLHLWRGEDLDAILARPGSAERPAGMSDPPPYVDLGADGWVSLHPLLYVVVPAGREPEPPTSSVYNSVKDVWKHTDGDSEVTLDLLHYDSGDHIALPRESAPRFLVEFVRRDPGRDDITRFRQQAYLAHFVGREMPLRKMMEFVTRSESGHLMVWGGPGAGKGALLSRFAEDLKSGTDGCDPSSAGEPGAAEDRAGAGEPGGAVPPVDTRRRVVVTELLDPQDSDPTRLMRRLCERVAEETEQKRGAMDGDAGALADRLRRLLQSASGAGYAVVLVIDGLDEPLRAQGGGDGILANCLPQGRLPDGCHLILSSRPLGRVRAFWNGVKEHTRDAERLEVELGGFGSEDFTAYMMERLNKWSVIDNGRFVGTVFERSKGPDGRTGNPLYLRLLVDAVSRGQMSLADADRVPDGLVEQYRLMLERLCGADAEGRVRRRVLTVVSLARRPVPARLVELVLGIDEKSAQEALADLAELLQENPETPDVDDYSVFHKSLAEYVETDGARREDLDDARGGLLRFCGRWPEWVREAEQEARTRQGSGKHALARALAEYALAHLAEHMEEELLRLVPESEKARTPLDRIAAALALPGDEGAHAGRVADDLVTLVENEDFREKSYLYCGSAVPVRHGIAAVQRIAMARAGEGVADTGLLARMVRYALWYADERPRKMRELVGRLEREASAGRWARALELAEFADTARDRVIQAMLALVSFRQEGGQRAAGPATPAEVARAHKAIRPRVEEWLKHEPPETREAWTAVCRHCGIR